MGDYGSLYDDSHVACLGRNKKQSGLDEDGMIRPAEKVEDGYCLANKRLDAWSTGYTGYTQMAVPLMGKWWEHDGQWGSRRVFLGVPWHTDVQRQWFSFFFWDQECCVEMFSVCEAECLLLTSQLGMAWANHGVKPRITPVNTRGVQELLGEDAKYKSIPVNYKNPVSSYIDLASEISRNQLKCVQRCPAMRRAVSHTCQGPSAPHNRRWGHEGLQDHYSTNSSPWARPLCCSSLGVARNTRLWSRAE